MSECLLSSTSRLAIMSTVVPHGTPSQLLTALYALLLWASPLGWTTNVILSALYTDLTLGRAFAFNTSSAVPVTQFPQVAWPMPFYTMCCQ